MLLDQSPTNHVYLTDRQPLDVLGTYGIRGGEGLQILNHKIRQAGGAVVVPGPSLSYNEFAVLEALNIQQPRVAIDFIHGLASSSLASGAWHMFYSKDRLALTPHVSVLTNTLSYLRTSPENPFGDDETENFRMFMEHMFRFRGLNARQDQELIRELLGNSGFWDRPNAAKQHEKRLAANRELCDNIIPDVMPGRLPLEANSAGLIWEHMGPLNSMQTREAKIKHGNELMRILNAKGEIMLGVQQHKLHRPDALRDYFPHANIVLRQNLIDYSTFVITKKLVSRR